LTNKLLQIELITLVHLQQIHLGIFLMTSMNVSRPQSNQHIHTFCAWLLIANDGEISARTAEKPLTLKRHTKMFFRINHKPMSQFFSIEFQSCFSPTSKHSIHVQTDFFRERRCSFVVL